MRIFFFLFRFRLFIFQLSYFASHFIFVPLTAISISLNVVFYFYIYISFCMRVWEWESVFIVCVVLSNSLVFYGIASAPYECVIVLLYHIFFSLFGPSSYRKSGPFSQFDHFSKYVYTERQNYKLILYWIYRCIIIIRMHILYLSLYIIYDVFNINFETMLHVNFTDIQFGTHKKKRNKKIERQIF